MYSHSEFVNPNASTFPKCVSPNEAAPSQSGDTLPYPLADITSLHTLLMLAPQKGEWDKVVSMTWAHRKSHPSGKDRSASVPYPICQVSVGVMGGVPESTVSHPSPTLDR